MPINKVLLAFNSNLLYAFSSYKRNYSVNTFNKFCYWSNFKIIKKSFKQKSNDELEAKQNVQIFEEHLIAEEIEKLVERAENVENVEVDSSSLRQNDNPIVPDTRLEPKSDKESPEVEITIATQPVNVNEE
nr:hypothetical protein [Tanacetum cinerariifolium]